jgi:hypothetical protein
MKHKSVYAPLFKFKRTGVAATIAKFTKPRNLSDTCFLGGGRHHREVVEIDIRIYFSGVFFTVKYRVT